jgi:colanic acid biosynthesis glycosyl transferase WcaI
MNETKILFINTFEPVVPLYRDTFPYLIERNWTPEAMISACQYRDIGGDDIDPINVNRLWVPKYFRSSRRLCAMFYFLISLLFLMFMKKRNIVFLTQPPMLYIVGSWIARARKIKYTIHVMDLYPELLFGSKIILNGAIKRLTEKAANKSLCKAEHVIVLGRCMEKVVKRKGVNPACISIVENWPERSVAESLGDGRNFRKQYGLKDKVVIMYSGNMGKFHNFDTILNVAKRLEGRENIVFVFIGRGVRRSEIDRVAGKSSNILLLEYQPAGQFKNILAAGDVHFVSLRAGYEGLMVPSKFYSVLAAGRPVIYEGKSEGEIARVVIEEGCGKVIELDDADQLEKSLLYYASHRDEITIAGRKSRESYENRFKRQILARRYSDILTGGI